MLFFAGYNPLNFIIREIDKSIRTVFYVITTLSTAKQSIRTLKPGTLYLRNANT
jgi:hypothetical protein